VILIVLAHPADVGAAAGIDLGPLDVDRSDSAVGMNQDAVQVSVPKDGSVPGLITVVM
jgi:hypothetical protein